MSNASPLELARRAQRPSLPKVLLDISRAAAVPSHERVSPPAADITALFPLTAGQPKLEISLTPDKKTPRPLRVGVVFSGGQAPGGHNVIIGLFEVLKKIHPQSQLFGFLNGPNGILKRDYRELTHQDLEPFLNTGGFDLIGSGRTKIETPEQFDAALATAVALQLDGLVIIGGDDSNTNAALLAEFFRKKNCSCRVVGAPKTIDGDLRGQDIEVSFGFDTACKTFAETIGNIERDALSAKKYYHFIKLMGRSASHIALECALQTCPNVALIGEEISRRGATLQQVTQELADVICRRAETGKNYGVILIPEGIIEFIPDCQKLMAELNLLLAGEQENFEPAKLSAQALSCFHAIPKEIQSQLLLDRDPHGNVQVSKIETERLLISAVADELERRRQEGKYKGKFSPQPHFLGYEGRSCFPSLFDATYCYALGYACGLLLDSQASGYVAFVKGLNRRVEEWTLGGCPLTSMIHLEERKGAKKPVIRKTLVDLEGQPFRHFSSQRTSWAIGDHYRYPGPIQFFGPPNITYSLPLTLAN